LAYKLNSLRGRCHVGIDPDILREKERSISTRNKI